jgi:RimJ/RimL family protein N-acetyltransferase
MDVTLRRATLDDARFVWEVNNHPSVRMQSVSTSPIPWETHQDWFARKVADHDTSFYIASCEGASIGVVRFDFRDNDATISIAVSPPFRGKGLGSKIIANSTDELARGHPGARAIAWVRADNVASLRAFARAGYVRTGSRNGSGIALERLERFG